MKHIVLTGLKHVGKSTLGYRLARFLDTDCHDLDTHIERLSYIETGRILTVRQIWKELGEIFFRKLETQAAEELSAIDKRIIIATGGGIIDNPSAISVLRERGFLVYLKEEPEIIFKRIKKNGIPPFLDKDNPLKSFMALYNKRHPAYKETADLIVDLKGSDIEGAAKILITRIKEMENAR